MKIKKTTLLLLLLIAGIGFCFADDQPPEEILRKLIPLKGKIETIRELESAGLITRDASEKARQHYLQQAKDISGKNMTPYQLQTLNDPSPITLSASQRVVGKIIPLYRRGWRPGRSIDIQVFGRHHFSFV
ncbi:MAG: hypothetical protein GY765_13455 [bacterium]|nr:hypothetical protein [bacterium]